MWANPRGPYVRWVGSPKDEASPACPLSPALNSEATYVRKLSTFLHDDAGQGLVEYALILVLVSIVAIVALTLLGQKASNSLSNSASQLK